MAIAAVPGMPGRLATNEFEELFQEQYQMVYRTAYSILDNAEDAEDVLQTVFLRLMRRELPPGLRNNVRGYFYRAAVNVSLDVVRSRKRFELIADGERMEILQPPSDADVSEQTHKRLAQAIAELSPEASHILILRYFHDYSDAQIAKLLGVSRTAIAVRLFRSRARLKKLMQDCSGE
jgi:RNA polymerase sigma-70 factor, ECF subfamily